MNFTDDDLMRIGAAVIEAADMIFTDAGAESDFCLQDVAGDTVIFGGTNRLVLNCRGWAYSNSHCTETFMQSVDKHCLTRFSS